MITFGMDIENFFYEMFAHFEKILYLCMAMAFTK